MRLLTCYCHPNRFAKRNCSPGNGCDCIKKVEVSSISGNAKVAAMSLYDDLGVGASDTKTEGWSKNFKLLQSQLKVKKAALTQAKVGSCMTTPEDM